MSFRIDSRQFAERLKFVRIELFGEDGIPELCTKLGLSPKTWNNYEQGVTMPADVLLAFIELTSVDPKWLARGKGPRRRALSADRSGIAIGFSIN
jgi:hypothetical protein